MQIKTISSKLSLVISGAALALSMLSIINIFGTLNPVAIIEIHQDRREYAVALRDTATIMDAQRSLYQRWAESGVCLDAVNELGIVKTEGKHFSNLKVSCDAGNWIANIQFTVSASYATRYSDLLPNSKVDGDTISLAVVKPAAEPALLFNPE